MKNTSINYLGILLLVFTTLAACIKEEFDMDKLVAPNEWNPEIAIPLVHSRLSVADILAQGDNSINNSISEEPDGLILLVYRDTLFSVSAPNYIPFPVGIEILNDYAFSDTLLLPIDSIGLNLEIYNNLINGNFVFEDPKLEVIVTNSIGIPLAINLMVLEAWSPINGTTLIELDNITAPIPLNPSPGYPLVPGNTEVSIYSYDKTNSNLNSILANTPKYIRYSAQGITNVPPTTPNFITDSSHFNVEMKIELPLFGSIGFLTLGDTIPFQMDIGDPSGEDVIVSEAVFVINTYNDFPVDVNLQLLFLDSNQIVIDSLYYSGAETILSSALLGPPPELRTYKRSHKVTEIKVTQSRLESIARSTNVIIKGQLSSTDGGVPLVKVYSDYELEVKLAVRAKMKLGSG